MEQHGLSYREVIPDISNQEEWNEIILNTGNNQNTLQDIKVPERAGGFYFRSNIPSPLRNRFIYWRTFQDVLELSEISLDLNICQNNLRYKFTDTPVLSVNIFEQQLYVIILVTTVSSLHRICFHHPNVAFDGEFVDKNAASIFREANPKTAQDPANYYSIPQNSSSNNPIPHVAENMLSDCGELAYFALAYQTQLVLFVMNSNTGLTTVHYLRDHIMPRLFSNIKGALIGKSNPSDSEYVCSLIFTKINGKIFLFSLYRDGNLKMWSTNTMQHITSINLFRDCIDHRIQGPQTNLLRKGGDQTLFAFLSHSTSSEFVCIDIRVEDSVTSNISLIQKNSVQAPQLDLTDFILSSNRIWALWCNAEGEYSVSSFLHSENFSDNWISAALEPPPDRYLVGVEQGMDPRLAYCSYIFHPGKFDRNVVANALFMFRRCSIRFDTKKCHISLLKEHVCQSVEEEIQNEIRDFDITDDEYLEISTRMWERFYSCCEQYHMKSCQPLGILLLGQIDSVCIIKRNSFSMLRPCEILEHLMLRTESIEINHTISLFFPENEKFGEDLVNMIAIVAQLEKWLPENIKIDFDTKLNQLEDPKALISTIVNKIRFADRDMEISHQHFMRVLREKIGKINNVQETFLTLVNSLKMDNDIAESYRYISPFDALFASDIGISLLSETVRQVSQIRFALCRNLLILQELLLSIFASVPIKFDSNTIQKHLMPETIVLLQSYYVMTWVSVTPINFNSSNVIVSSMQRLHLLHLVNNSQNISGNGGKLNAASLLRVFLKVKGLQAALGLHFGHFDNTENLEWQYALMPLAKIVKQLIWSISSKFVFGEWLFSTCQHIIIEDYVRLLNNWCPWNICSRKFILAVSLLNCGEDHKAYDLFLQAAEGLLNEPFLKNAVLKDFSKILDCESNLNIKNRAIAQYYLKVIQLFEQHNALDHIISIAQVAISILPANDKQLPMFQCIIFNNHLTLEHYQEAYQSIICNAELSRQKDCLRQLIVTLFSTKRLDLLMQFPYAGLREEFENIVESRARSLAMDNNDIYDFLYAFHVDNGNMRKASAIMYEQAMRLQLESDSIESMQKRCSSLLVCINALNLIDKRYRWIAKPMICEERSHPKEKFMNSHENDFKEIIGREQIVVLEIEDVKREFLLAEALFCLARQRNDIKFYLNIGPQELTIILSNSGLFTSAIKLAQCFNLKLLPIFESLTAACVRTGDETISAAWYWLQENDLADLPYRNKADEMAWSLLRKLVEDYEEENATYIRRCVVNKLLSLNAFIPQWLHNSYKGSNCFELLWMYVKHNRLLEASDLMTESIYAMLGAGSEYFSFKHPISLKNSEICLPLHTLDILLNGLKLNKDCGIEYKQALMELDDAIQNYSAKIILTGLNKIEDISLRMVRTDL